MPTVRSRLIWRSSLLRSAPFACTLRTRASYGELLSISEKPFHFERHLRLLLLGMCCRVLFGGSGALKAPGPIRGRIWAACLSLCTSFARLTLFYHFMLPMRKVVFLHVNDEIYLGFQSRVENLTLNIWFFFSSNFFSHETRRVHIDRARWALQKRSPVFSTENEV